jgi:hypothetical protein
VDEEAVDGLEGALGQVLVRPVDRVARLEADDALPAALGEEGTCLPRILVQLGEGRGLPLEHRHGTGQVEAVLAVQPCDTRMLVARRQEAALGLELLVVPEDLLHLEHRDGAAALVGERHGVALGRRGNGEADRERPGEAACKSHVVEDPGVVRLPHEARERRQRSGGEHVEVGELAGGEGHDLE